MSDVVAWAALAVAIATAVAQFVQWSRSHQTNERLAVIEEARRAEETSPRLFGELTEHSRYVGDHARFRVVNLGPGELEALGFEIASKPDAIVGFPTGDTLEVGDLGVGNVVESDLICEEPVWGVPVIFRWRGSAAGREVGGVIRLDFPEWTPPQRVQFPFS